MRWNLKEAGGKVPARGTRITSGAKRGVRLQHKLKPKSYTDTSA
ncbi:hypothetical protein [Desulfosporosinus orientis]|nr:hypothetical protein [Desulfosporosinus orientis]